MANKIYKFEQFIDNIECVSWELIEVIDNNKGGANATIKITDVNGHQFGVQLSGFDYGNPNVDVDLPKQALKQFIANELKKYEV